MKRKTISKKLSILLVCLMAMCLVGCSDDQADNNSGNDSGTTQGSGSDEETGEVASGSETGTDSGTGSGSGTEGNTGSDSTQGSSDTNGAGTAQTGTPQASEANPINDNITGYYSETVAYPLLENEIIDELDYENQDMSKTRYYYNYVDLDGDNIDEIIVQLNGEYNTTNDGDTLLIVKQTNSDNDDDDDDGFDITDQFTAFVNPVIISDNKTNGYRDLIFMKTDGNYSKVTYGKDGYGKVSDGETLKNIDDITGVALLCNDVASDTQNNSGLFFSK